MAKRKSINDRLDALHRSFRCWYAKHYYDILENVVLLWVGIVFVVLLQALVIFFFGS